MSLLLCVGWKWTMENHKELSSFFPNMGQKRTITSKCTLFLLSFYGTPSLLWCHLTLAFTWFPLYTLLLLWPIKACMQTAEIPCLALWSRIKAFFPPRNNTLVPGQCALAIFLKVCNLLQTQHNPLPSFFQLTASFSSSPPITIWLSLQTRDSLPTAWNTHSDLLVTSHLPVIVFSASLCTSACRAAFLIISLSPYFILAFMWTH